MCSRIESTGNNFERSVERAFRRAREGTGEIAREHGITREERNKARKVNANFRRKAHSTSA